MCIGKGLLCNLQKQICVFRESEFLIYFVHNLCILFRSTDNSIKWMQIWIATVNQVQRNLNAWHLVQSSPCFSSTFFCQPAFWFLLLGWKIRNIQGNATCSLILLGFLCVNTDSDDNWWPILFASYWATLVIHRQWNITTLSQINAFLWNHQLFILDCKCVVSFVL